MSEVVSDLSSDVYYDMDKPGLALIFNHYKFLDTTLVQRNGTHKDVQRLKACLQNLNFLVKCHDDLKANKLMQIIQKAPKYWSKNNISCLMVIVLTHGELGILHAYDETYKVEQLWEHLIPPKCHEFEGIPKLFLIAACRGNQIERIEYDSPLEDVLPVFPSMSDIIHMYPTCRGFKSIRIPIMGTIFVQTLCEVFEQRSNDLHLIELLTIVSQKVITKFKTLSMKQQAEFTCTLTKFVKFKTKLGPNSSKDNLYTKKTKIFAQPRVHYGTIKEKPSYDAPDEPQIITELGNRPNSFEVLIHDDDDSIDNSCCGFFKKKSRKMVDVPQSQEDEFKDINEMEERVYLLVKYIIDSEAETKLTKQKYRKQNKRINWIVDQLYVLHDRFASSLEAYLTKNGARS